VMITFIKSPGAWLKNKADMVPTFRDVTLCSVSTLDLFVWTPEIQSSARSHGWLWARGLISKEGESAGL
jgi:hypothetical protein